MLTKGQSQSSLSSAPARVLRRRVILSTSLGATGLGAASLLMFPKLAALMSGSLEVIGLGAVANLALVFGSLMFLREAQSARALLSSRSRPDTPS
jgi:hypothetical protein